MPETNSVLGFAKPLAMFAVLVGAVAGVVPAANADDGNTVVPNNARLNNSVYVNIDTMQKQAGCTTLTRENRQLKEAARRHAVDAVNNPGIDGDVGSDGSMPQDRARDAGFNGRAVQTVATKPSIAINAIDVLGQWYWDPASRAKMEDCANIEIGVWTENSLTRSVLVAVYGQPA